MILAWASPFKLLTVSLSLGPQICANKGEYRSSHHGVLKPLKQC